MARFYLARVARVYPLHIVGVVLAILVFGLAGFNGPFRLVDGQYWIGESNSTRLAQLITQLALVQSWSPENRIHYGLNGPSWSISCEAFFYAFFPFIIMLAARTLKSQSERRLLTIAMVVTIIPALAITVAHPPPSDYWFYIFPPTRLVDFAIGVLLGVAYLKRRTDWPRLLRSSSVELMAVGAFALLLLISAGVPETLRFSAIFIPGSAFVIYVFAHQRGSISRVLSVPWMVRLGEVSFAFYIVHFVVIVAVDDAFPHLTQYERIPLAFIATLALSFALFHFVEQPMRVRIKSGFQALTVRKAAVRATP